MNGTRRRRTPAPKRGSLIAGLGQSLRRHVQQRLSWYIPACTPIAVLLLAHLLTLIVFLLIHLRIAAPVQEVYKVLITWAVYGFVPLLFCSYLCYFALAKPGLALLARKLPHWSDIQLHLFNGLLYGAGIGLVLLLLLQPGVGPKALMIFLTGLVVGLGNWLLYRKLSPAEPLTGLRPTNDVVEEIAEP